MRGGIVEGREEGIHILQPVKDYERAAAHEHGEYLGPAAQMVQGSGQDKHRVAGETLCLYQVLAIGYHRLLADKDILGLPRGARGVQAEGLVPPLSKQGDGKRTALLHHGIEPGIGYLLSMMDDGWFVGELLRRGKDMVQYGHPFSSNFFCTICARLSRFLKLRGVASLCSNGMS